MSALCLLLSLSLGTETMGPAPALAMIEDDTPIRIVAVLSDSRFPEDALAEMRTISAEINHFTEAAEREVLAAARCRVGADCAARMERAVTRLQCVDDVQVRANSALESSERAVAAMREAEANNHPDVATIQRVEHTKVRVALDRVRQGGSDANSCFAEPQVFVTVSYQ